MANPRTSLKDRRAQDARGVDAIITPTDAPGTAPAQDDAPTPIETVTKMTIYVRPEQVIALEEIQLAERRRTGKRKDKSELVQEAFDLLIEKYRSAK